MENLDKIKMEFKRIKELGFLKSGRSINLDGGIGNTFEDHLGVEENNLKDPDFIGFEVKTQRFLTSSYITLFSKSPTNPKYANSILKEKYGEVRDENFPDLKILYASIFGDKWSVVYNKHEMKINVDYENKRVVLNIKEGDEIFDEVFWDFNTLKNSIQKLNKLFIVFADVKVIDNIHHYHYKQGEVYLGLDFNKFLNQLNLGNIQFDIRIGVYKSGPNYGKPHDHGSGFRIKKGNLGDIYTNKLTL